MKALRLSETDSNGTGLTSGVLNQEDVDGAQHTIAMEYTVANRADESKSSETMIMQWRLCVTLFARVAMIGLGTGTMSLAAEPLPGFKLEGDRWTYQDGTLSMRGVLLKPAGEGPFPAVLISHGLGGNAEGFGRSKGAEFVKWGLVCLACDYTHAVMRGGQTTPEERETFGASDENLRRAAKCLDILASRSEVDAQRLCAYGHSMGGFVTIGLAAREPERLRAAAISGSGIAPRAGFAAPAAGVAARIKTPLVIFHGQQDTTVRPAQSAALEQELKAAGAAVERHLYPGVGHAVDRERAREVFGIMQKWFHKHGVLHKVVEVMANEDPKAPRDRAPRRASRSHDDAQPKWVREPVDAPSTHFETFTSATIGQKVSCLVYLPAEYQKSPARRFPVVYWLHGIGGAQTGIPRLVSRLDAAIADGKAPAMLFVFVNGMRDSFYCDAADGKTPVESVIVKDLVPHIDATYRTVARREGRMIEGFSMGGFGAAHLGFKYPERFGSVSVIDGALLDVDTMRRRHAALFDRVFGGSQERFQAEHPESLLESNIEAIRGRSEVRQSVGALVAGNESLHQRLSRLGLAHEYTTFDVGHNQAAIYDNLGDKNWAFYQRAFKAAGD